MSTSAESAPAISSEARVTGRVIEPSYPLLDWPGTAVSLVWICRGGDCAPLILRRSSLGEFFPTLQKTLRPQPNDESFPGLPMSSAVCSSSVTSAAFVNDGFTARH